MNILNLKNKNSQFNSSSYYVNKGKIVDTNITEITNISLKMIKNFFSGFKVLCGRPEIVMKSNFNENNQISSSIQITIPYYSYDNESVFTTQQFYGLQVQMSEKISMNVVLRIIHLKEPYMDATVLAEYISNELVDGKFFKVMSSIMGVVSPLGSTMNLPIVSNLIGLKVNISGRLNSERSQPRMTKQSMQIGSFILSNQTNITLGSYTTSNKKGSNTVRVWISHLI